MIDEILELEKDGAKYLFKDGRYFAYYQFGLQRTGTTIVERLIGDNFKYAKANDLIGHSVRPPNPSILTWKHEIDVPVNIREGIPFVLNYKNPYTWLESMMYRKGAGNGGWQQTYGEMYKSTDRRVLFDMRIDPPQNGTCYPDQMLRVYRHWFDTWINYYEANQETTVLIKYEDLVVRETRDAILDGMWRKFNWPEFNYPEYSWPVHCGSSQAMTKDRVEYYIKSEPTQLDQKYIDLVPQIIGEELMTKLGYPIL